MEPITYIKIALALIFNLTGFSFHNETEIIPFNNQNEIKKEIVISGKTEKPTSHKASQQITIDCGSWKSF